MNLHLIAPAQLPDCWNTISSLLGKLADVSHGKFEVRDIVQALVSGAFQLWVMTDEEGKPQVVYLGRIVDFPRRRVYEPLAVASTDLPKYLDDWLINFDQIEGWAKAQGCTLVQPLVRPGLGRILRGKGYKLSHVLIEKEI